MIAGQQRTLGRPYVYDKIYRKTCISFLAVLPPTCHCQLFFRFTVSCRHTSKTGICHYRFVSWQSTLGAIPEWHTPRHPGECPREDEADYPPRCHRWSDQIQTAGGGQNEQQCWKCQSAWWSGCPMRSHRVARQPPSTSPSVLSGTKTSVSARLLIETAKVISDDEICLHCFIYLDI